MIGDRYSLNWSSTILDIGQDYDDYFMIDGKAIGELAYVLVLMNKEGATVTIEQAQTQHDGSIKYAYAIFVNGIMTYQNEVPLLFRDGDRV